MGSRNIKKIKGKDYLYYVVSEDGKKRAIYCGLASDPETEQKALKLELEQLKEQKKVFTERISRLETILKQH